MRATVVAGIGGLLIGHVLWLLAISLATSTTTVNAWVLGIAAVCALSGLVGGLVGWRFYRRRSFTPAAFAWCVPLSPVVLSLCVLAETYL